MRLKRIVPLDQFIPRNILSTENVKNRPFFAFILLAFWQCRVTLEINLANPQNGQQIVQI
jgi:hypothetical protein